MIPVDKVEFFWNAEVGAMPTEFVATDRGRRLADLAETGFDSSRYLSKSLGSMVSGWNDGSPINSPEGVFARVFLKNLSNSELQVVRDGLEEFCKVDGQDWAVRMAGALDEIGRRSLPEVE